MEASEAWNLQTDSTCGHAIFAQSDVKKVLLKDTVSRRDEVLMTGGQRIREEDGVYKLIRHKAEAVPQVRYLQSTENGWRLSKARQTRGKRQQCVPGFNPAKSFPTRKLFPNSRE